MLSSPKYYAKWSMNWYTKAFCRPRVVELGDMLPHKKTSSIYLYMYFLDYMSAHQSLYNCMPAYRAFLKSMPKIFSEAT